MTSAIKSIAKLFAAALYQRPVTVWIRRGLGDSYDDMPIDEGGIVERITPSSMGIRCEDKSKTHFLRDNVEFRI